MILITGGAGYIGSAFGRLCSHAKRDFVVLDDLCEGHRHNVPEGQLVIGNVGDSALVERICRSHGVTSVVHFAASCYVGVSVQKPLDYYDNNVARGVGLLRGVLNAGVRKLVFSSSCATYGQPNVELIDESASQQPINPYGKTKLVFEMLLRDLAAARSLNALALRYFNAAGADPSGTFGEEHVPETHVIPRALTAALDESQPFTLFGDDYPTIDGTCVRDYVHIDDLATAHLSALQLLEGGVEGFDAFNLGTGEGNSVRDLLSCIETVTGRAVPTVVMPRRLGDPPRLVANPARAQQKLGWRAVRSDLATIVEDAWRFAQSHQAVRGSAP
ncbi:MAG: UDP-glucose 4-epimerase GalE [bacterium]|nr:UDP-glucose 4-epimerase GalE [bacterium]